MTGTSSTDDPKKKRERALNRLSELIDLIKKVAEEQGWSTRPIQKRLKDGNSDPIDAPALVLQLDFGRVLVEPIAIETPGSEGVVDLYLMPAYDDMASIYFYGGGWHIHYMFPDDPTVGNIREAKGKPLSKEVLVEVLNEIKKNAT